MGNRGTITPRNEPLPCVQCGSTERYKRSNKRGDCKECARSRQRAITASGYWRKPEHLLKRKTYSSVWRKENPELCAEYKRSSILKRLYGITRTRYDELVMMQDGKCAICHQVPTKLVIDHDHETGLVRGLLCSPCNTSLGGFHEDVGNLVNAIKYLSG